jgi:PPP family 3-phenylpropionic acid transporter
VRAHYATVGPFLLLFALLYAGFGVASPFMPAFMESKGISAEQIGLVFGLATAIRLISAPMAGRIADRTHALRAALAVSTTATALTALGYLPATGFWALIAVALLHALALAPTTNLADALAVVASRRQSFEYGWARGSGSAAFIIGSIAGGFAISASGIWIVVVLQALLMLAVPFAARWVPPVTGSRPATDQVTPDGLMALLQLVVFRRVVLVAALVLGSHALHDTFSIIRWTNAGVSPQVAGLLWSLAVAAEVVMFFGVGPWLLARLQPAHAMAIAAVAGAIRWLISAVTVDLAALVLIQPLHGVTFALLHLACMRILAISVPPELAATAQAIYGTVGIGTATALLISVRVAGWAGILCHEPALPGSTTGLVLADHRFQPDFQGGCHFVKTFGSPASRSRALQPEMPAGGALPRVRTRHHPLPSAIPPLPRRP